MDDKVKLLQEMITAKSIEEMAEIAAAHGMSVDRDTLAELYNKVKAEEAVLHGEQGELTDDELEAVSGGKFGGVNSLIDRLSEFFALRLFGKTGSSPTIAVLPAGGTTPGLNTMEMRSGSKFQVNTMEYRGGAFQATTMEGKRGKKPGKGGIVTL